MIPKIDSLNRSQSHALAKASPSIPAAQSALNQERKDAPTLDNRVSKKSRTTYPPEALRYPLDDTHDSYKGGMLNRKYHGHGLLIHKDDSYYNGEFKNGLKHGKGVYFYDPSHHLVSLEGEFAAGEPVNGTLQFRNGSIYSGSFKNWKRHGQGTETFYNGAKYIGEHKDDLQHGMGIYFYVPSHFILSLEGTFVNGMPIYGTLQFREGGVYSGSFKNWKRHGQGTEIFSDGAKYIGGHKEDLKHGKGVYYHAPSDPAISLKGEFKNGKLIEGTIQFKDGSSYSGSFKNWQFDGQGVFIFVDGSEYSGEYKSGKRNGWGTLKGELGHYEGLWENDNFDFTGKLQKIP